MSIFYHVSTNLTHPGIFKPRIPSFRHKDSEDDVIPRVCVAPSIEGCLTAIPEGGMQLGELCWDQRYYFLVFRIDTQKLGIPQNNIITSDELFKKDLVRDAEITNEHWITTSFVVPAEDRFLILVDNWAEESADVIPYEIYQIADKKYEGDYFDAYQDIYGAFIPCATSIENLIYTPEHVTEGCVIQLSFHCLEEKMAVLNYITQYNLPLQLMSSIDTPDNAEFCVTKATNLKNLFLEHFRLAQ